ncbi:ABC transporter substrate-binding protein [Novosphingobium sp. 9]|uniref:ABC transporter substrate-binding protein n=1 Tax=Novosphingobium sp. 9 TaxID=2025349 RepID=UPI0021B558CC|nr:ABC transporter substrate-binding protein [Novosphingobium sp. 9]
MPLSLSVPRFLLLGLIAASTLMLGACHKSDGSALGVAVIGQSEDPFLKGDDLPPARRLLLAATAEGLVSFDEQGRVVPALADRWIVTDDGLSYIFRLRDGDWSNGDPITARSGRAALQAALRSQRDKPLGRDLAVIDEVRAMASRVIEIRLSRPRPIFCNCSPSPNLACFTRIAAAAR